MPRVPKSPTQKPAGGPKRTAKGALSFPRKVVVQMFSHDDIAARAYELFLESGSQHGYDVEHWLRAEQELGSAAAREAS